MIIIIIDENYIAILYRYDDSENNKELILSYINMIQGINYDNEKIFIENQTNIKQRVSQYIFEYININGTLVL